MAGDLLTLDQLPIRAARVEEYFDLWGIEESRGLALFDVIQGMNWAEHLATWQTQQAERSEAGGRAAAPTIGDIAVIPLSGTLMKQVGSGDDGTSTIKARRMIRQAANNPSVRGILLVIDSPGGTVSGTADLADDVRLAAAIKPVEAYVQDLCASAAYWIASQADRVTANRTAVVGSIGTFAVVQDLTGMAAMKGIKVHVVRAGAFKGAGTPGTEITAEQLAEWQRRVDGANGHFLAAVGAGRKLSAERVKELADGRTHTAADAVTLKLIDGVDSLDATLGRMVERIQAEEQRRKIKMSEENKGPIAATLAELKAACPGASAEFLMGQLERQATVGQATTAYMQQLTADKAAADKRAEEAKAEADKKIAEADERAKAAEAKAAAPPANRQTTTGLQPIADGGGSAPGGNAKQQIESLTADRVKRTGEARSTAMRAVMRENPALVEQMNAAHNAANPDHTPQMSG